MPFSFSDEETYMLSTLSTALPPALRDGFLQLVANKLATYAPEARGIGLVYRLAVEVQRDFLKGGFAAVGVSRKMG
ncbi:MAG TPA: hypothetical protein VGJ20_44195 [Xanthobacteraceae bacterium]|jgi:hypothetical protein